MNSLVLWRLKKFCNTHELDHQEIDNQLTYWENLTHLKTLTTTPDMNGREVEASEIAPFIAVPSKELKDRWRAQEERYNADYIILHYLHAKKGETKSVDMGPPIESAGGFSLTTYIQRETSKFNPGRFSLKTFTHKLFLG